LGPLRTRLQRSAGRGLTKFVGREREMDAMKHAADRALSGHGQIVAAMAEAGTGKSRLYFEFKARNQSGWMVLETFSVSHGKASAYLPVLDLLHGYFKIAGEDDQRTRREKLTGRVLALDRSLEDTLPYLFSLLGIVEGEDPLAEMDGQLKKRRTLEAIKRIVLRESLNQPLMMIFEDLHWIDEVRPRNSSICSPTHLAPRRYYCWSTTVPNTHISGTAKLTIRSCGSIRSAGRAPAKCCRRC
jgi:hypothetical protein